MCKKRGWRLDSEGHGGRAVAWRASAWPRVLGTRDDPRARRRHAMPHRARRLV